MLRALPLGFDGHAAGGGLARALLQQRRGGGRLARRHAGQGTYSFISPFFLFTFLFCLASRAPSFNNAAAVAGSPAATQAKALILFFPIFSFYFSLFFGIARALLQQRGGRGRLARRHPGLGIFIFYFFHFLSSSLCFPFFFGLASALLQQSCCRGWLARRHAGQDTFLLLLCWLFLPSTAA